MLLSKVLIDGGSTLNIIFTSTLASMGFDYVKIIFERPMLACFMAIPNHTYLILKMPGPKGVLSIWGDIKTCFEYNGEAI